jgi:hypothetical protein
MRGPVERGMSNVPAGHLTSGDIVNTTRCLSRSYGTAIREMPPPATNHIARSGPAVMPHSPSAGSG